MRAPWRTLRMSKPPSSPHSALEVPPPEGNQTYAAISPIPAPGMNSSNQRRHPMLHGTPNARKPQGNRQKLSPAGRVNQQWRHQTPPLPLGDRAGLPLQRDPHSGRAIHQDHAARRYEDGRDAQPWQWSQRLSFEESLSPHSPFFRSKGTWIHATVAETLRSRGVVVALRLLGGWRARGGRRCADPSAP
jgi:hypothetical protein